MNFIKDEQDIDDILMDLINKCSDITKIAVACLHDGLYSKEMLNEIMAFGVISSELKKYLDRPSDEEMVETVLEWYENSSKREQAEFITTDFENLVVFMHTLGQNILKTFNLWYYPWDKKIKDGVDVSEEHPEAVALRVIEETWRQLQDES